MRLASWTLLLGLLAPAAPFAADRTIALNPIVTEAWSFSTGGPTVVSGPNKGYGLGVGFWQRSSGAKVGVGANFITSVEFQLPENAPSRIRSASYQFSGKASQCVGNEPVVIDVYAYPGDGKAAIADASAGTRLTQMTADCKDNPAFARPIDVTQIVRQLSVAAGIRHVGFNIRKANNRQGPSLFNLSAGKLTVVVADQDVARAGPAAAPTAAVHPGAGVPVATRAKGTAPPPRGTRNSAQ